MTRPPPSSARSTGPISTARSRLPARSRAWSAASRSASSSSPRTGRTACAGSWRSACRCSSTSSSTTSPTPWPARSRGARARGRDADPARRGRAEMLRAAVEAARARAPCPQLLGVTVLTSLDDADLAALGIADKVPAQVLRLAGLAWDCGLDGVVCAPQEIAVLRSRFAPDFKLVVPGIRPAGSVAGDQKRTHGAGRGDRGRRGRAGDRPADHRGARSARRGAGDRCRDRGGAGGLSHGGRGQGLRPHRPRGARRRGRGRRALAGLRLLSALAARAEPRAGRRSGGARRRPIAPRSACWSIRTTRCSTGSWRGSARLPAAARRRNPGAGRARSRRAPAAS